MISPEQLTVEIEELRLRNKISANKCDDFKWRLERAAQADDLDRRYIIEGIRHDIQLALNPVVETFSELYNKSSHGKKVDRAPLLSKKQGKRGRQPSRQG